MSRPVLISPSILTADFGRIEEEIRLVAPHVDQFHLDVMDGHYVENITFGASTVEAVRKACDHLLHVHLMISDPVAFAAVFRRAGADRITFHPEVVDDVGAALGSVRRTGAGVGLAVHPDVPLEMIEPFIQELDVLLMMTVRPGFGGQAFMHEVVPKIARARELVDATGSGADVEVDGGVKLETVEEAVRAGADIVVAGSAIYDGVDPVSAAKGLRARIGEIAS